MRGLWACRDDGGGPWVGEFKGLKVLKVELFEDWEHVEVVVVALSWWMCKSEGIKSGVIWGLGIWGGGPSVDGCAGLKVLKVQLYEGWKHVVVALELVSKQVWRY